MSNNSWKQYGGISKTDNFNTINASTIIADQFISRSVRPTYNFFNGTFEVALDLSAGVNILAGNSIYSAKDVFVNRDLYTNNKLFFGNNTFQNTGNNFPALAGTSTHAYLFGNSSNIGVNTILPKTAFNITGTVGSVTDILTVESGNVYVRNIIAQNVNQRGVVVDADDVSSNILFYNDVSTNKTNIPDATIKFQDGGILTTRTTNRIINSSRTSQIDTSGGQLLMDASGTVLTSSGYLSMDVSGEMQLKSKRGYLLNTSGGMIKLDQSNGNMQFDASNDFIINCSGGAFLLNDDSTILRTVGNITLLSSGKTGVGGKIVFDSSGGNIDFNSGTIKLNTLLQFSPPGRGVSNELLHSETLTVYDNSNSQYLPNVYNDPSILTGNAATFTGKDPSANTFIYMNPAINKRGSAFGGGTAPYASSRAMAMVGLTGSTGEYIHSQMTVASTNKYKYPSTLGINTYRPRTEDYVLDVNGPMHLGNGEINSVAENSYEIIHMNFSKTDVNYGIAVGSPSTKSNGVSAQYKQFLLYTHNGGKTWSKSDILLGTSIADNVINVINHVHVVDSTYSAIAANNGLLYLSNNSGISWYRLQLTGQSYTDDVFQTIMIAKRPGVNPTPTHRIIIAYKENSSVTSTSGFYYIDCDLLTLFDNAPNFVINIAANRIGLGTNIYPASTGNFNIISASLTNSYIYYAGDFGLARYKFNEVDITTNVYTSEQAYILQPGKSYKGIYAFDDTRVIAVGNNVISYTTTGIFTGWTHINIGLPSAVLNSVFIYDLSNAVAVGSSGKFLYSTNWSTGIWQNIPDKMLNSSGMADRVTGPENQLKSISMPDINTMIIADATASFIGDSGNFNNTVLGYSKIQYCFLPNLFNRTNNTVFDVSGNMVISGDIEIFDGELLVSTIDYKQQNAADISGTINIGTKTHVVNIGKTDERTLIDNPNTRFDLYDSVINIGVTNPVTQSGAVAINIGNYERNGTNYNINKINIGGGLDNVTIGGILKYSGITIDSYKNKGMRLNDNNLNDIIKEYFTSNGYNAIGASTDAEFIAILNTAPANIVNGITYDTVKREYIYTVGGSNAGLEAAIALVSPFGSGGGTGIRVTDNLDRDAGYLLVSEDMNGWVMKPTNPKSNSLKIDVSSLTLRDLGTSSIADMSYGIHNITNGIAVLTRTIGESDSSYSLTVKQLDIDNILVRDSVASSTIQQVINTKLLVKDDVEMKQRLYVGGDASFNGNVDITGLLRATSYQNNYIINTVTNNYEFIVTTDLSMSGNLYVNGDVSLNGFVDISERVAIGKSNPVVALDISYSDAIRIPHGTTAERPDTAIGGEAAHGGYIRYNNENHQFEGYGPGNSWGSLGGVINVAQNTKILASSPNADSSNNDLMFFTAPAGDLSANSAVERMRIDGSGNVGIGTSSPRVILDISDTDAIRIPVGTTAERPSTSTEASHGGYIRYNNETHQFEGYGPGNSWGSLGGVINVAQNTKIVASSPNADSSNNELMFFTAPAGDLSANSAVERMRIKADGDISMNGNIQIGQNASLNSNTAQINMGSASTVVIKHNTASGLDIDSSGNIFINANYGTINLGNNAIAQNINIGSGASARTIQVGNAASREVKLDASNITLNAVNALNISVGTGNPHLIRTTTGDLEIVSYSSTSSASVTVNRLKLRAGSGGMGYLSVSSKGTVNIGGMSETVPGFSTEAFDTAWKLDVNGNVRAVSYNAVSDIRLKTNIQPIINGLVIVNQLNGVSFSWKTDTANKKVFGLIAQEVESVLPEIVNTTIDNNGVDSKTVHYDGLFPYLIESVKTLAKENETLKTQIASLESKVDLLMSRLSP